MLTARGHLRKKVHASGNEYFYIHIPSRLAHDSQFPFSEGDELIISVDVRSSRIIIEKANDSESGQQSAKRRARQKINA
jgi:bifunctional DNA-binding transcriptional regulator/antitoxin component of YhaV-PrlF toxin-antitoxin module